MNFFTINDVSNNLLKSTFHRFPAVFNNFYSPTKYKLSETEVSRTSHSASAFAYGLFEGTGFLGSCGYQPVDILSTGKEKDIFLRFFDTCQVYKELHETKKATFKQQQRAFRRSSLYRKVLQEVSTKLNLESMDYKLLKGIYRLCSYRTVHFGELSTWCEFLTVENLYVLEFHEDLKHWWKKSYAYEANYKIAAPLLEDLLNGIIQSANGGKLNAHFRFAHAETLQ
ncbi:multiple inositol polyphosphate phosphatase 1-like [Zophobas morio]|uniref:multiple inositol polyphosphate phosphatase 1-like n=1 Tax=Zophobas morio TaxID=2755281 RepID=UPI0030833AC0